MSTPEQIAVSTPKQVAELFASRWARAARPGVPGAPHGPVLIATDFDGVLAPLVDDPLSSRPTPAASAALDRLAGLDTALVCTALVSGRALDTLAQLSGAPAGTFLVGSHGSERGVVAESAPPGEHPQVRSDARALDAEQQATLERLVHALTAIAHGADGAWVETKPAGAVLHTRTAARSAAARATAEAVALAPGLGLEPLQGKDVVEYAVLPASKGTALQALRAELSAPLVVYLGDDVTDERAFAVLGETDLGVKVGAGPTVAAARVAGPQEAADLLLRVGEVLEHGL